MLVVFMLPVAKQPAGVKGKRVSDDKKTKKNKQTRSHGTSSTPLHADELYHRNGADRVTVTPMLLF
jgi:hypothetical protein